VGAILGAVNGAWTMGWMAAVWPWQALYAEDPLWPLQVALGQVVVALLVGLAWVVGTAVTERWWFFLGGARRLSRREAAWLLPLYDTVAGRMGLRSVPTLLIDDRRTPNAYCGMRHVVVHQGLLDELANDRDAVAGVLAHELAHWRAGDAAAMTWAKAVSLPLYLLYEAAYRLLRVRVRPLQWLVRALLWSVLVTVKYFVAPVQRQVWRRSEYAADAAAQAAGYGESLRRALAHLRGFESGRDGWEETVYAVHPPVELRMERLEAAGRRYPPRDDFSLAGGLLDPPTSSVRRGEP
jgi:Zn-dependent protease with chaperone function